MPDATIVSEEAGAAVPASPPRENLYRAQQTLEVVRDAGNDMPTLTGHFAVHDQWTEIRSAYEGNFMERFAPGAFTKTIQESAARMRVLFDHGHDPQIGNKPLGAIRNLVEDEYGVRYDVTLFDTGYVRDLLPALDSGQLGASFRFSVVREDRVDRPAKSEFNPRGIPERTVTEARVPEFGPVTFPAYHGATAGLRSVTDEILLGRLVEDPDRLIELIAALRGRTDRADTGPEPSEATTPPPEPEPSEATTHSERDLFWFAPNPDAPKE